MAKKANTEYDDFSFLGLTPDLVCVAGKDGFFKKVNPSVVQTLGYSEKELLEKPISTFIHPDDQELTNLHRASLLNGTPLLNFENRYITKSGKIVWLEWTSIYFADKEIVFAIAKDATRRKNVEKEVEEKYQKFRSLATYYKSSIERDRKYLANELHEELAQLASVIQVDINSMKDYSTMMPAGFTNRMEHALAVSELLIATIRRISFSISPNMLEDLGLNATLEWLCKEFSILNGIPCSFKSSYREEALSPEVKMDLFRISQSALTNVMYHAQARKVQIRIEEVDDLVCLTVIDDGKGFTVEDQAQARSLNHMRHRASSINGHLTISSKIGQGTSVSVAVAKSGHSY